MEWPRYSLAEVAPACPAAVDFAPTEVVWHLGLEYIESHTGRITTKVRAPVREAGNSTFTFDEGNVLYSKLRPYLNKVVLPDEPGIATTELVPLRPRPDLVLREYLAYYLRAPAFLAFASQFVTGAKMPRVILDKFWTHKLPLPPLSEQRRIVEILDQADRLRRLRAEADAKADRILSALFLKMFGDPATNPMGWAQRTLGDVVDRIESGWSPVCENRPAAADEWGVLKLGAVTSNCFLDSEHKALPAALMPRPKLETKPGDLLFTRKNTRELVGACAYVRRTRPKLMLSDLVFRLKIDASAGVHPVYLWALLTSPSKRPAIEAIAGGSAGSMPNISKGRLCQLLVEVPPFALQNRFAEAVESYEGIRCEWERADVTVNVIFSVLLSRAFDGSLTASWREAHMNELLHEMEQQAKALAEVTP